MLGSRIIQHDARMNAARFANWEQDEQIAAAELGRKLADDPESVVGSTEANLGRLRLADRPLDAPGKRPLSDRESSPYCNWTEADLALALNLLGRPLELRHLDTVETQLELPPHAVQFRLQPGRERAAGSRREQVAELEAAARRGLGRNRTVDAAGLAMRAIDIDLGPEGTRLRAVRGGGRSTLPLGLDQTGTAAEGERRADDASLRSWRRPC